MPIKASSVQHVDALIVDLGAERVTVRDAAVARLTVLGARAVDRLLALVASDGPPGARAMGLRVLEAIADTRALDRVLEAIDAPEPQVSAAAVSAARAFLRGPRGASVVDRLTRAVLDTARDDASRVEALDVLRDLESTTIAPLLKALGHDPRPAIQAAAKATISATPAERVVRAAEQGLPDNASELAEALTSSAAVALPVLLRVIEQLREREASKPAADRADWTRVRGRAHLELANRGSRVALYDLRETLETAESALPIDFLAALSTIGDASCLEPVAGAYERSLTSTPDHDHWWRDRLADAFRAIVKREGITRRHAVAKKLERRMKAVVDELWAGRAGEAGRGRRK